MHALCDPTRGEHHMQAISLLTAFALADMLLTGCVSMPPAA